MPLYGAVCSNGHKTDFWSRIDDRDNSRQCDKCGANLTRLIEAPAIRPDICPYLSPVTGDWVNSRVQRKEDLARSGSIPWEPGLKEEIHKNRLKRQEEAFKPISDAIDSTARELVSAGVLPAL